jgi:hypothetical protein
VRLRGFHVLHISRDARPERSTQKPTIGFPECFTRDTIGSRRIDFNAAKETAMHCRCKLKWSTLAVWELGEAWLKQHTFLALHSPPAQR